LGEAIHPRDRRLVLLVDNDDQARREARHHLEQRGMDVIQASNGLAAVELIQRLPRSFRLVLTELDLPGIPGPVIIETLRLFRPDLPTICLSGARVVAGAEAGNCLSKPLRTADLDSVLKDRVSRWEPQALFGLSEEAAARARARFSVGGDLVEAALEIARGVRGQT
jgi:DNA-binding response OmpR family regulator